MGSNQVARKRRVSIKKIFLYFLLSVFLVLFAIHLKWKYSGSGQWEFVGERDGVKVYSLKSPGSVLAKYRGVTDVNAELTAVVAMMQDNDISGELGLMSSRVLNKQDDQFFYATFKGEFPKPFKTREYVIQNQFYQNPHTLEVLYEVSAVPSKLPPNDCCFRVSDMNNLWHFTPKEDGVLEMAWTLDMFEGGFIPYFMSNFVHEEICYLTMPRMQEMLDREKYQNVEFSFIKNVETNRSTQNLIQQ